MRQNSLYFWLLYVIRVFRTFQGNWPVGVATGVQFPYSYHSEKNLWPPLSLEPGIVAWKADLISLCQNVCALF